MFIKRVLNILVTLPLLLITLFVLIYLAFNIAVWIFVSLDNTDNEIVTLMAKSFVAFIGLGVCSLCLIIICFIADYLLTGEGVIFKKVEAGYYIKSKEGNIVHIFTKDELISRFPFLLKQYELCKIEMAPASLE